MKPRKMIGLLLTLLVTVAMLPKVAVAAAGTAGISRYQVEFTYGKKQYVLKGDESVALSKILVEVGLGGEATAVQCSDDTLFSASREAGEWVVTAHRAFTTTEWMKVTIDGSVYEITVTDEILDDYTYAFSEEDENGITWVVLEHYIGGDMEITIPSEFQIDTETYPVALADGVFSSNWIKTVTISNGVKFGNPFARLDNLMSATFEGDVGSIGEAAFSGCPRLQKLTFGGDVDSIGKTAFSGCLRLQELTFGGNVGSIGEAAFSGCISLHELTFGGNVGSIGEAAFSGCSILWELTFEGDVGSIGEAAFSGCSSLRSVGIPASVTSIGSGAFDGCVNLSKINFGGTRKQWIDLSVSFSASTPTIYCSDSGGDIALGTWGSCPWEVSTEGVLTIHAGVGQNTGGTCPWAGYAANVKKVICAKEDSSSVVASTDCSNLFKLGWDDADSGQWCSTVESMDLSGLDTSSVTTMNSMFSGCSSLERLETGAGWTQANASTQATFPVPMADETGTVYREDDVVPDGAHTYTVHATPAEKTIDSVELSGGSFTYNGKVQKPTVSSVKAGETELVAGDYEVAYSNDASQDAGTYTVTVTAREGSGFTGSVSATYEITRAAVTAVTLSKTSYVYTGKVRKPVVSSVKAGALALKPSDYSVSYKNSKGRAIGPLEIKAANNYKVIVTGKGNFTGSATASFRVAPAKNMITVKATSVKKTIKADAGKSASVSLPKMKAKFGKARWTVAKKDKKKVLNLSGSKVTVKAGAKKGTYTIKLKAKVAKTANYSAATKIVTVKVTVK